METKYEVTRPQLIGIMAKWNLDALKNRDKYGEISDPDAAVRQADYILGQIVDTPDD